MNEKLIKELREGKIAIYYNKKVDSLADLALLLQTTFKTDRTKTGGNYAYYFADSSPGHEGEWTCSDGPCPIHVHNFPNYAHLEAFFTEEKTFPRKMLVWQREGAEKAERMVLAELPGNPVYRYITANVCTKEELNEENGYYTSSYRYAEEIPEENSQKQILLDKADELIKKAEELKQEASKL